MGICKLPSRKPKRRARAEPGRPPSPRGNWYKPTVNDVYAVVCEAQTMLNRIPDGELAIVKREMCILEDMLWQFATAGNGSER